MNSTFYTNLQVAQLKHDERFPKEITYLSLNKKLNHFTLHLAKYVGRLWEEGFNSQDVVDLFIITLSSSNMLNIDLSTQVISIPENDQLDKSRLLGLLTITIGKLAKACEAQDHLEDFPVREVAAKAIISSSHACLFLSHLLGIDLINEVPRRLASVQSRSIFKKHLLSI